MQDSTLVKTPRVAKAMQATDRGFYTPQDAYEDRRVALFTAPRSYFLLMHSRRNPCTDARPAEICVAPVDASRDFLSSFPPNEQCGGWGE